MGIYKYKTESLTRLCVSTAFRIFFIFLMNSSLVHFENSIFVSERINILDVPGYETTNMEERYHTEAILRKYMSVSSLNIVVQSIYDINDSPISTGKNKGIFVPNTLSN